MTCLKFIPVFLVFALSACDQTPTATTTKSSATKEESPFHIIFGKFCGQCSEHCATMYRYDMTGMSNSLFVDSTDSFFKNEGKIVCNTPINDHAKFHIVNKLVRQIPSTFYNSTKASQTFGCPDCTDGCGIYFELVRDMTTKKFYIDFHTSELDKEVKDFGELVKETLAQLNKKNDLTAALHR